MRGGISTVIRAGCARQFPALSARVPMVSYSTIRLRVWYLANAAAKHLRYKTSTYNRYREGERERERERDRQTYPERERESDMDR